MKKTLSTLLLLAVVGLVTFVVLQAILTTSPELRAAQSRAATAKARRAEVANQVAADTSEAAILARQVIYVGGAVALAVLMVGGAVAVVVFLSRRASEIRPTKGGQFPIVKVGGRTWAGFVDPNRSPSSVTAFDRQTGTFAQPTPLSEAATLQLMGQATAAAMIAGATRHPSTSRANMLTAVDAVMRPSTLSRPLPPVEVFEDADHIDRLLALTADEEAVEQ